MFFQAAAAIAQLPPEINKSDALMRTGSSLGIDMKGLVKSPEELQAEMQAQQQQQMMAMAMEQGIGPAVQAGGRMMEKGMENGTAQEG
jgi:hypothetical protein